MGDKHEWRLTWSGQKDTPMLRACVEHLRQFTLFKDSEAHLITHAEYVQMVAEGKIEGPESYWQIREGEVGLVSKMWLASYTKTWESIGTAKSDFCDGWCKAIEWAEKNGVKKK